MRTLVKRSISYNDFDPWMLYKQRESIFRDNWSQLPKTKGGGGGGGEWGTSPVLIVLNTHQNFNYDMHTNFYVMANPIPIITLYRDPPETNEDINLQVNFRITHRYV